MKKLAPSPNNTVTPLLLSKTLCYFDSCERCYPLSVFHLSRIQRKTRKRTLARTRTRTRAATSIATVTGSRMKMKTKRKHENLRLLPPPLHRPFRREQPLVGAVEKFLKRRFSDSSCLETKVPAAFISCTW